MENLRMSSEEVNEFKNLKTNAEKIRLETALWKKYSRSSSWSKFKSDLGITLNQGCYFDDIPEVTAETLLKRALYEEYDSFSKYYFHEARYRLLGKARAYERIGRAGSIVLTHDGEEFDKEPDGSIRFGYSSVISLDGINYLVSKKTDKVYFGTVRRIQIIEDFCGSAEYYGFTKIRLMD